MKHLRAVFNGLVCLAFLVATLCAAHAAVTVKGTLFAPASADSSIKIQMASGPFSFRTDAATKFLRGQLGKELRSASIKELAPGDHLVAVVNQTGVVSSVKAFYGKTQGTLAKMQSGKLVLKEGKSVVLAGSARVLLPNGKIGKPADLKPGAFVICRTNPVTNQAWTVVATSIAPAPAKPVATVEPVKPTLAASRTSAGKPVIRSVAYICDDPIEPGDVITVQMSGTAGGQATCEIKDLIPLTPMKEVFTGSYTVTITVPDGKIASNSPLVGKLVVNGASAEPVQAAKLVTVAITKVAPMVSTIGTPPPGLEPAPFEPVVEPEVAPAAVPEPAPEPAPVVVVPPVVEPRAPAPVVLTQPANGARIERAIVIRGIAEPGSTVRVTVTYTNSRTGLLRLNGTVASQDLAVGNDGEFRLGPLPLEGPLATKGLRFRVEAGYPESAGLAVTVIGARS